MRDDPKISLERGENPDTLEERTRNLAVHAKGFRWISNHVRKEMRWKNMRVHICLVVGVLTLPALVVVIPGRMASISY